MLRMNLFHPLVRKYALVANSELYFVLEQQRRWAKIKPPIENDEEVVVGTIVPNGYGGVETQKITPNDARELLRLRDANSTKAPWMIQRFLNAPQGA